MIRFCEKEAQEVYIEDITRTQMLSWFLKSERNRQSVLLCYKNDGFYYGMATYQSVLANTELEKCINKDVLVTDDSFWDKAGGVFAKGDFELYPVVDLEGNFVSFAYDEEGTFIFYDELDKINEIPINLLEYMDCKIICIVDCNEFAWKFYNLFKTLGYTVCVIGDKWEWFGIKQKENYDSYYEWERFMLRFEGAASTILRQRKTRIGYDDSIMSIIQILYEWIHANINFYYKYYVSQYIKNGVSVAKVLFPNNEDVEFLTMDEYESIRLQNHPVVKNYSEKQLKNLYKFIGKEEWEYFLKNNTMRDLRGWKRVSYISGAKIEKLENINAKNRIYLIGNCVINGIANFTKNTLVNKVQALVGNDEDYEVVKVCIPSDSIYYLNLTLKTLPIKKNDIILVCNVKNDLALVDGNSINLQPLYDDQNRVSWILGGETRHTNAIANKAIATEIYEKYLKEQIQYLKMQNEEDYYVNVGEILDDEQKQQILDYVNKIREFDVGVETVGAIVMNCNPFTKGHQYLIEYASSKVDFLYVFVVEENLSEFSFEDRIKLVQKGTNHLDNIKVVPSSRWILSYETLPMYFEKTERQEELVDAEMDLEIFGRYIAPELNIKVRFVGEEPIDKVTKQYNEQMKDILSYFVIEVCEVERKMVNNEVISASRVRKCIKESDWSTVEKLVPKTTFDFLRNF